MNTIWLVSLRSLASLARGFTAPAAVAGFVVVAGALFLRSAATAASPVAEAWASAAVPVLPVLCALLTMRLVADERASGRLDAMLAMPIRERDWVLGRFLGAYALALVALFFHALVPLAAGVSSCTTGMSILSGIFMLALQALTWCAVGTLASAYLRGAAVAALVSVMVTVAMPYALLHAGSTLFPAVRARFVVMPFEAHASGFATGLFRLTPVVFHLSFAAAALFAASKTVAGHRLRGRMPFGIRVPARFAVLLAFSAAALVTAVVHQFGFNHQFRIGRDLDVSARTREILSDTQGEVRAECFVSSSASERRMVENLLEGISSASRTVAGARISYSFVDPRWDVADAARLVREGVEEGSIVFRRARRKVVVKISEVVPVVVGVRAGGWTDEGEAVCASAIQRLSRPMRRETVYWTRGHGETPFDSYDSRLGMSTMARKMASEGYDLRPLDLAQEPSVPDDCAVLLVAGASKPFSRVEKARLRGWLAAGGRMLVMASNGAAEGVRALPHELGLDVLPFTVVSQRTLTGSDVVVSLESGHRVTRPLAGSSIVFGSAVAFTNALPAASSAADRTTFVPLALSDDSAWCESDIVTRPWTRDPSREPGGPLVLAAALERGGERVLMDTGIRPGRVVLVGDALFVSNGAIASRANANVDFFMNALAWLAGLDAQTSGRSRTGEVVALDRDGVERAALRVCCLLSLVVALPWFMLILLRRRRTS